MAKVKNIKQLIKIAVGKARNSVDNNLAIDNAGIIIQKAANNLKPLVLGHKLLSMIQKEFTRQTLIAIERHILISVMEMEKIESSVTANIYLKQLKALRDVGAIKNHSRIYISSKRRNTLWLQNS